MAIKVKEIKETERPLTFPELCIYSVSKNAMAVTGFKESAKRAIKDLGFVSVCGGYSRNIHGYYDAVGTIRKETIRDATTEEIQAYLILKYDAEVCSNGPKEFCNQPECVFKHSCPITVTLIKKMEDVLKDKEVYEE